MRKGDSVRRKPHVGGLYSTSKRAADVKADLQALATLDKVSEGDIRWWERGKLVAIGAASVGGLGIVVMIMSWDHLPAGSGWFLFLFVLLLASGGSIAVVAFNKIKEIERDEFLDYRYLGCLGLVTLLEADMAVESPLDVSLNLKRRPDPPERNQGREVHRKWMTESSREVFLTLRGRLQDGTRFAFALVEEVHADGECFSYRSASGKARTKLKARKSIRWSGNLKLRFKQHRYALDPSIEEHLPSLMQMPEGTTLRKAEVGPSELSLVAVTAPQKLKCKTKMSTNIPAAWSDMEVDEQSPGPYLSHFSAMMFMNLYQILNSSKPVRTSS